MDMLNSLALEVPIVSARYAYRFIRFMESRGVKRHTILEDTGVTEDMLESPEASLSMNQVLAVLGKADWLMTDERAAFEFGQQLDLSSHGLLGFAVLGQENRRRLSSMIVEELRVLDTCGLGNLRPCLTQLCLGSIHRVSSWACSHSSFRFDFPSAIPEEDWKRLAPGCEFEFDANVSQVTMPLNGLPIREDDASLEFLVARTRHDRKQQTLEADETVMQVRELIMSQPGRPCITENIARRLDISPRTLRQHLASAGTSFRELRNDIRESFATLYLKDTNVPLESIAEKLGFSDQAGFTKAYRSWTGNTPGDVRRKARKKK